MILIWSLAAAFVLSPASMAGLPVNKASVGVGPPLLPKGPRLGLIGFVSGFLSSIPTGPISLTIINEGARRGFRWAALIGFGAIVMDFIYCAVAFAGFSGLFSSELMRATMQLLSFLATLYLGIKYLVVTDLPATTKTVEAVEHKLHPHTAFMIGFVREVTKCGPTRKARVIRCLAGSEKRFFKRGHLGTFWDISACKSFVFVGELMVSDGKWDIRCDGRAMNFEVAMTCQRARASWAR